MYQGRPESFTKKRKKVIRRSRNKCAYCGGIADTVDHVKPRSLGGSDDKSNLTAACRRCNNLAGDKPFASLAEKRIWIRSKLGMDNPYRRSARESDSL